MEAHAAPLPGPGDGETVGGVPESLSSRKATTALTEPERTSWRRRFPPGLLSSFLKALWAGSTITSAISSPRIEQ
jgi:hypothetical protein